MQETKISRQELSADIAVAEGYESFFSCTRTVKKGRVRYSGEILNHFVFIFTELWWLTIELASQISKGCCVMKLLRRVNT